MEIRDGAPLQDGLYVVYVNGPVTTWVSRQLLTRAGGQWRYVGSDQRYRAHVYGWIGPIPAMELES